MFEVEDTFRVLAHRGAERVHGQLVQQNFVFDLECVLLDGQQRLQPFVLDRLTMERHHRLAEAEEKPAHAVVRGTGGADADSTGLFVNGKISHQNAENIDATSALFDEVAVFNGLHENAPSDSVFTKPLLKGAAVAVLAWRFQTGFRGANE